MCIYNRLACGLGDDSSYLLEYIGHRSSERTPCVGLVGIYEFASTTNDIYWVCWRLRRCYDLRHLRQHTAGPAGSTSSLGEKDIVAAGGSEPRGLGEAAGLAAGRRSCIYSR